MLLLTRNDPWGSAYSEPKKESNLEMMISLRIILLKYQKWACHSSWERKGLGAWRRSSGFCALTPNPELLGGLQSQLSVGFSEVIVPFEHVVSEGQKVSTSSLFFSMAGLSRMLQGDNEPSNKKFIIGRLSWSFWHVSLTGDEILKSSLESLYFQHLIMKMFTTQRKPLKQFWMHILASSCACTPCLFRELSFAEWGMELATVKKRETTVLMCNREAIWLSISVTDDSTSHQYLEQKQRWKIDLGLCQLVSVTGNPRANFFDSSEIETIVCKSFTHCRHSCLALMDSSTVSKPGTSNFSLSFSVWFIMSDGLDSFWPLFSHL